MTRYRVNTRNIITRINKEEYCRNIISTEKENKNETNTGSKSRNFDIVIMDYGDNLGRNSCQSVF